MNPPWSFTTHAVERYIERHAPGLSLGEARKRLAELATLAVRGRERPFTQIIWTVGEDLIFVTIEENGQIRCLTVLGEAPRALEPQDEAVRAAQRAGDFRRQLRRAKERRRSARREVERVVAENGRLRACLGIAVRGLQALECLDVAAAALAQIENLGPQTPGTNK